MTKDEALKIALEALEWSYGGEPMPTKEREAMDAIRQVLDQLPDTTKMIDNLTKAKQYLTPGAFVPIDMETTTLLLEALRQALAEWAPDDTAYRPDGLSQEELPPVKSYCGGKPNYCEPEMPVDRGAWSDVPDATKWVDDLRGDDLEPVARVCPDLPQSIGWNPKLTQLPDEGTLLYAELPKKEWAGLTDDELRDAYNMNICKDTVSHFLISKNLVRDIEAKLKEKNNG